MESEIEISDGFLVVKTFERMHRDYLIRLDQICLLDESTEERDSIPLEQMPGKYRGIAREPIFSWYEEWRGADVGDEPIEQELDAHLFMTGLRDSGKAEGCFVFSEDDARKLFAMIRPPLEREIMWIRRMDRDVQPPSDTEILGYEPIDFYRDFSSVITSVVFFRYRRSADPDGKYAKFLHARLNQWGLFDNPADAQEYVDSIPLQELPWQDRPRHIAEVRT
jgi:hypothetical protein